MIYSYAKFIREDGFNEDFKSYSTIGVLRYLPTDLFWELLRASCICPEQLPARAGTMESFEMWPRWRNVDGTKNSEAVEPDVFIRFSHFDLIVEAKKKDFGGQDPGQWKNETVAYRNEYGDKKAVFLLALGGNDNLNRIADKEFEHVHKALWTNLLRAVHDCREQRLALSFKSEATGQEIRILEAVEEAFVQYNEYVVDLLESIPRQNRCFSSLNIHNVWPMN